MSWYIPKFNNVSEDMVSFCSFSMDEQIQLHYYLTSQIHIVMAV